LVDTHQTVAQQPGVALWGRATVWWCSITFSPPFQSLFKLPLISIKFRRTPALRQPTLTRYKLHGSLQAREINHNKTKTVQYSNHFHVLPSYKFFVVLQPESERNVMQKIRHGTWNYGKWEIIVRRSCYRSSLLLDLTTQMCENRAT